jgi:uncharacterized protein (TIGR00375 family)
LRLIADLHIHSRFSRGCSKDLTIKSLEKWARIKGISLLGTGDFQHPEWLKELKGNLKEDRTGILRTGTGYPFMLTTEISLIYSQGGRGYKVHNVVLAPDFDVVDRFTKFLLSRGRIDYDGRPIFKIPCPEFVRELRKISTEIEVIPAHIWTPHFSMFGSNSGFDTVLECFGDQAEHVHAIETGLSSDPLMNWRLSQLDRMQIVSFSDSHSYWPWRLGREATIFDTELTYPGILKAIRTGEGLVGTIEVDPNYGKYHLDGHRNCNVMFTPEESRRHGNICPVCKRELTIGVLNRVEELADRKEAKRPNKMFYTLIPLHELIAAKLETTVISKKTWELYNRTLGGKSEYEVMLDTPESELLPEMAELIMKNRRGDLTVLPGYDGVYGDLQLDPSKPRKQVAPEYEPSKEADPAQKKRGRPRRVGEVSAPKNAQSALTDFV